MGSGSWIAPVAIDLALVTIVAIVWWHRCAPRPPVQRVVPAPCAPRERFEEPELVAVWHPADSNDPAFNMRTIVSVERTKSDEISLILQPVDGMDQAALLMSCATSDLLSGVLRRARFQEVHP